MTDCNINETVGEFNETLRKRYKKLYNYKSS